MQTGCGDIRSRSSKARAPADLKSERGPPRKEVRREDHRAADGREAALGAIGVNRRARRSKMRNPHIQRLVMAVDAQAANDSLQTSLLKMACPAPLKCFAVDEGRAAELLKKYAARKVFVVAKHPDVYLHLVELGVEIEKINVGGPLSPGGSSPALPNRLC